MAGSTACLVQHETHIGVAMGGGRQCEDGQTGSGQKLVEGGMRGGQETRATGRLGHALTALPLQQPA